MYLPTAWRARGLAIRRAIMLVAAVIAAVVPAAPTGLDALDLLYRVVLAAVVVAFGARAQPWVLVGAAALTLVGAWTDPLALAAAGAGGGLAVAVATTTRRSPVGAAVVALLLTVAALRLEWPRQQGATAVIAGVVAVVLVGSGLLRSPRTTRTRARAVAGGVAALMAVVGAAVAVAALEARRDLESGSDAVERALDAIRSGDDSTSRDELDAALIEFEQADATLHRPWTFGGVLVPVVAQHLDAARATSGAGVDLASTAAHSAAAADVRALEVRDGGVDLERLRQIAPALDESLAAVRRASRRIDDHDSRWLAPPVADRLDREQARLARADRDGRRALDAVTVLPELLGGNGARRYFLAIQTPSEARASGGFIGNYGELVAEGGRLSLGRFGRTEELQEGGDPEARRLQAPQDYVARYSRFDPAVTWQNVTMSPDVPTVAQVVASLYPQSGGTVVDGMVTVDPRAIAAMLKLTGPLTVAPWPEPLTAANAERILLHDQYLEFDTDTLRAEFLGDVAEAVTRRLTTGQLPSPPTIVKALASVVAGKHLAVATTNEATLAPLRRLGIAGAMAAPSTDSLAVITQNAGGNKIDWFLHRSVRYDATIDAEGNVAATIEVALRNDAPPSGLPDYIIGNVLDPPVPVGTNKSYVSIYTPWTLSSATVNDAPTPMESERELGRNVYSRYVLIPPGATVTFRLDVVGSIGADEPRYAIALHRQPLVNDDNVDVHVRRPGRDLESSRELDRDYLLSP